MKGFQNVKVVNMVAGEDLRSNVFHALTVENDGGVCKVIKAASATSVIIGFLAENPRTDVTTDGLTVPVALVGGGGIGLGIANAAITAGALVIPTTTAGKVDDVANIGALADDQAACGVAMETAASGDIFPILFQHIAGPHGA